MKVVPSTQFLCHKKYFEPDFQRHNGNIGTTLLQIELMYDYWGKYRHQIVSLQTHVLRKVISNGSPTPRERVKIADGRSQVHLAEILVL